MKYVLLLLVCSSAFAATLTDYSVALVPPRFEHDDVPSETTLDPRSWTIELLVQVKTNFDQVQTLAQWGVPDNYSTQIRLSPGGSFGLTFHERKHRFDFNIGASAGRELTPGQWLYCVAGMDFKSGREAVIVRDEKGELSSRRCEASRVEYIPADKRVAWDEIAQSLTGTAKVKFGGTAVQIAKVRISNRFREDLLLPQAQPITEAGTLIPAIKIDPKRVQTRTVDRTIGYTGHNNFVTQPTRELFIPLAVGSEPIRLPLKNLGIGVYTIHVYGTIDPQGRDKLERVWRPCPMAFELHDASGRLVEQGRRLLRQGLGPKRMQAFSFHVNEPGDFTATFRLTDRAQEKAQIMWMTFEDQLSGLPDEAIKNSQNLDAGKTGQLKELTDERKKRDDLVWNGLPPLNLQLQVMSQIKECGIL